MSLQEQFIAKTFHGLEEILAQELIDLGAHKVVPLKRAVSFECDLKFMYKANLCLRTAISILYPIKSFNAKNENDLYKEVKKIDWSKYLNPKKTFAVTSVVYSEYFKHSKYVALKTKDAVADYFREKLNVRPSVDREHPEIVINVHISDNKCSISLDTSGQPLFKRGYRNENVISPINEVLAAGLIKLSEWDKKSLLIDGMCGSGTIPIEATMMAHDIPPCIERREFGFERWLNFDQDIWHEIRKPYQGYWKELKDVKIIGSDINDGFVSKAKANSENVRLEKNIQFVIKDFFEFEPEAESGTLIMNPPYDVRFETGDIEDFYKKIGDTFKQKYKGFSCWLISSNMQALKSVGLKPSRKIKVFNGALECKFQKYEIYSGSKKAKFNETTTSSQPLQ